MCALFSECQCVTHLSSGGLQSGPFLSRDSTSANSCPQRSMKMRPCRCVWGAGRLLGLTCSPCLISLLAPPLSAGPHCTPIPVWAMSWTLPCKCLPAQMHANAYMCVAAGGTVPAAHQGSQHALRLALLQRGPAGGEQHPPHIELDHVGALSSTAALAHS